MVILAGLCRLISLIPFSIMYPYTPPNLPLAPFWGYIPPLLYAI
nr:MAG TPA: hypothetical protein [Caudoviricetes sp.]